MISRRVRHVLAIAEEGSFSRAALRLGIGQPPLSQSVQRLEQELGVTLFERTARGARLTRSGEAFVADARIAVAAADRAKMAARAIEKRDRAVRVGVILPSIWSPLKQLLTTASTFGIVVESIDGSTEELLQLLADGRLDLSFVAPPFDTAPGMEIIQVDREPLVAALPDALTKLPGEFAPMAAMSERLIMPPRPYGPIMYDALLNMFLSQGLKPVVVTETTRVLTALSYTSAGLGSAIVAPSLARAIRMDAVSFRPFPPDVPTPLWEVAVAYYPRVGGSTVALLVNELRRLWQR